MKPYLLCLLPPVHFATSAQTPAHHKPSMMKAWFVCLLVSVLTTSAFAQIAASDSARHTQMSARNAIYVELGGTSVIYSLNYDRILIDRPKWKAGARVGVAFMNFSFYDSRAVSELFVLKPLRNRQDRYLEFGAGVVYRNSRVVFETPLIKDAPSIGFSPRFGVRIQKARSGLVFRLAVTPTFTYNLQPGAEWWRFTPWAGLSIGRSF